MGQDSKPSELHKFPQENLLEVIMYKTKKEMRW